MTLTQFEILPIEMSQISDQTWFLATEGRKKIGNQKDSNCSINTINIIIFYTFLKEGAITSPSKRGVCSLELGHSSNQV